MAQLNDSKQEVFPEWMRPHEYVAGGPLNGNNCAGCQWCGQHASAEIHREAAIDTLTPKCGERAVTALLNEADDKAVAE